MDDIREWVKDSKGVRAQTELPAPKSIRDKEIDTIIKKAIASVKGRGYNYSKRGDQTNQTRKGGE